MRARGEKGVAFTLVEMLVVIAVLAVLMAMLMPSLQEARRKAVRTLCIANQYQLAIGITNYVNAHDDVIVPAEYGLYEEVTVIIPSGDDDDDDDATGDDDDDAEVVVDHCSSADTSSAMLVGSVLTIIGSGGNDQIQISEDGSRWKVVGDFNGGADKIEQWFNKSAVTSVAIYACFGNDQVQLGSTNVPSYIDAGPGDDQIQGGDGADVIDGRDGNDQIDGKKGNDKLYGGAGSNDVTDGDGTNVIRPSGNSEDDAPPPPPPPPPPPDEEDPGVETTVIALTGPYPWWGLATYYGGHTPDYTPVTHSAAVQQFYRCPAANGKTLGGYMLNGYSSSFNYDSWTRGYGVAYSNIHALTNPAGTAMILEDTYGATGFGVPPFGGVLGDTITYRWYGGTQWQSTLHGADIRVNGVVTYTDGHVEVRYTTYYAESEKVWAGIYSSDSESGRRGVIPY